MLRPKILLAVLCGVLVLFAAFACYSEAPDVSVGADPVELDSGFVFDGNRLEVDFLCRGNMDGFACEPAIAGAPNWAIIGTGHVSLSIEGDFDHDDSRGQDDDDRYLRYTTADVALQNDTPYTMLGEIDLFFQSDPFVEVGGEGDSVLHCGGQEAGFGTGGTKTYYNYADSEGYLESGHSLAEEWCFDLAATDPDNFEYAFSVLVSAEFPTPTWCVIQHPHEIDEDNEDRDVYGRVHSGGLDPSDIVAQLGWGPTTVDPASGTGFTYVNAVYNSEAGEPPLGDNYEYMADLPDVLPQGTYAYVYRFSNTGGLSWIYCDIEDSDEYDWTKLGTITYPEPPDPCEGVVCDEPPSDECVEDEGVTYHRTYPDLGECIDDNGEPLCLYDPTDTACDASEICVVGEGCVEPPEPEWTYSQDFNSLASDTSGNPYAWTDDSTLPGWYSTCTTYTVNHGSSTTGSLYSYGAEESSDRALGSLASSTTGTIHYGVKLQNTSSRSISSLDISYYGEQWRKANKETPETLAFSYQVFANEPNDILGAGWIDVPSLDFVTPQADGTAGALDGNLEENRRFLSHILEVTMEPDEWIMLRWTDVDDTGADHGMAIDDLVVEAYH